MTSGDVVQGAAASSSGDAARPEAVAGPASVAARSAAFVVDAFVLAVVLGGAWLTGVTLTWALVVTTFVCYHGSPG